MEAVNDKAAKTSRTMFALGEQMFDRVKIGVLDGKKIMRKLRAAVFIWP